MDPNTNTSTTPEAQYMIRHSTPSLVLPKLHRINAGKAGEEDKQTHSGPASIFWGMDEDTWKCLCCCPCWLVGQMMT